MQNDISKRAMLCSLKISAWTARKYDKKISDKVADEHAATRDAGRYTKQLLPVDAESYKNLQKAISEARDEHYKNTLAWSDEGWRLLPTANYMQYAGVTRAAKAKFEKCLTEFLDDYPALRESAKIRLNGMYREEDYPSVPDLRAKFSFDVQYTPLPAEGDFRVSLSAEELAELEAGTAKRVTDAVAEAHRDAWQRLYACVEHAQERLADPKAIFRDSLIDHARELCDVLSRLNVAGDQQLETLRVAVWRDIGTKSADVLRSNPRYRSDTAKAAADILAAMKGVYGND